MDWKEIKFRVIEREFELLKKYAEQNKLKYGVPEIFVNYMGSLLKETFNYEPSEKEKELASFSAHLEKTFKAAQPYLDAFHAGELPPMTPETKEALNKVLGDGGLSVSSILGLSENSEVTKE